MVSFLLIEFTCALLVLVQLLFHTHIVRLNDTFLLLFDVLFTDLIEPILVLFIVSEIKTIA